MAINRCPLMPYSCNTLQSLSRGTQYYAFSRSTKYAKTFFAYSLDFSKICYRVEIWMKTTPAIFQLWFQCFLEFPFRHLAYTFPGRLRNDLIRTLLTIAFLCIKMITPVFQSFCVFPSFYATWNTLVNQSTTAPFNAFNISDRAFCLHQQPFRISFLA